MAPTTRRNGHAQDLKMQETDTPTTPAQRKARFSPSPYLLLVYPAILMLGSFFSTLSPTAAQPNQALTPGLASQLNTPAPPQPINYFASKHNLLNLYFVKIDWFWTTLAFILILFTTHSPPLSRSSSGISRPLKALLRYAIVTAAWIGTTQWFFGAPLIDRSFTLTGGKCEALPAKVNDAGRPDVSAIFTSITCKAVGGRWKGGHDISGHVFLLVLSSAFLVMELYVSDIQSPHPSVSPKAAAAVAQEITTEEKRAVGGWESDAQAKMRLWTRYFVLTVVGLDFWMLLMTAIWFHTWLEKLSGLLLSGVCIWIVYFLPAFVPEWRKMVSPA